MERQSKIDLLNAEREFLNLFKQSVEELNKVKEDKKIADKKLEEANERYNKYNEEWEEEKDKYIFKLDNPHASMEDKVREVTYLNNPSNFFKWVKFKLNHEKLIIKKEIVIPSDYSIYKQNKEKQRTYLK